MVVDVVYFSQLVNWGTFSDVEFKSRSVHLPTHPAHQEFILSLQSGILQDAIVDLGNLTLLKTSHLTLPSIVLPVSQAKFLRDSAIFDSILEERRRNSMAADYAAFDREVADYHIYCLDGEVLDTETNSPLLLRGPPPVCRKWRLSRLYRRRANFWPILRAAVSHIVGEQIGTTNTKSGPRRRGAGFFFSQSKAAGIHQSGKACCYPGYVRPLGEQLPLREQRFRALPEEV